MPVGRWSSGDADGLEGAGRAAASAQPGSTAGSQQSWPCRHKGNICSLVPGRASEPWPEGSGQLLCPAVPALLSPPGTGTHPSCMPRAESLLWHKLGPGSADSPAG